MSMPLCSLLWITVLLRIMAYETRSAKRKRLEETAGHQQVAQPPPPPPREELVRSDPWFEDGNLILRAEKAIFRVHRGVLARHSQIFMDMFAIPQPPTLDWSNHIYGCPVVTLYDKSQEVQIILIILYDSYKVHHARKNMHIRVLTGILRLGHKYEIQHLMDEGLQRLQHEYPSVLKELDAPKNGQGRISGDKDDKLSTLVANLATALNVQTVLPAVYFYESWKGIEHILKLADPQQSKVPLDQVAVRRCLIGHERLLHALQDKIMTWQNRTDIIPSKFCSNFTDDDFDSESDDLSNGSRCANNYPKFILRVLSKKANHLRHCFAPLKASSGGLLCSECLNSAQTAYDTIREDTWKELPTYFDLPAWKDLKNFSI